MSTPIHFRASRPSDEPLVMPLVFALYREDPSSNTANVMSVERFAATFREFTDKPHKGRILVFEKEQAVVGYAILVFFYSNEYGGDIIDIDELYVTASARGRGVASKFFEWLKEEWSERAVALSLQTTRGNVGAARLYERLGFKPHPDVHYLALLPSG